MSESTFYLLIPTDTGLGLSTITEITNDLRLGVDAGDIDIIRSSPQGFESLAVDGPTYPENADGEEDLEAEPEFGRDRWLAIGTRRA